jgi:hypothetical protein
MHSVRPTIIRVSPLRWTAILLGSLAFVAGGILMITDATSKNVVAGWLAILFFGFCAAFAAIRLIKREPELTIDDQGLVPRNGTRVSWSEVDSAGMRVIGTHGRSTEMIEVVLRDPQAYVARLTGAAAMAAKANLALDYSPLNIPYLGRSNPHGAVLAAMRRHHPSLAVTSYPAGQGSPAGRAKRFALRALAWGALVVALFVGISLWLNKTGDISTARVGKCLSIQGGDGNSAKVVDCGSSEARYKVVGQIAHKTKADSDGNDLCAAYADVEAQFWYGKAGEQGVVWCLAANR